MINQPSSFERRSISSYIAFNSSSAFFLSSSSYDLSKPSFKESESKEQIAEAETELAISFWRESRYTEALGWLQTASVKITNELSSINIKNLSYQLLVLFSINTTQSLQEGLVLIEEKDKLVDLCSDSYVKAHYFNNSALLMSKVEQLTESLHRHQKSIEFCKQINNQFTLAIAENNCGFLHNQLKEFGKAAEHTQKAISISQALGIRFLEAECWDTLAQIYLSYQSYAKTSNFSEALLAINTALNVLKTDNFIEKENQAKLKKRDATLVNILQTKAQILLHQNKINEALIIFSTICQNAPNHIIEVYAKDFSRQIEFIEGNSFSDKTKNYEKKLLEAAIIKCNGELTKISEFLEMPIEKTVELFELRHKDLSKQYSIKINSSEDAECKSSNKSIRQSAGKFQKAKNSVKVKLKKYECQGFSAFIPESIEIACIVPITEPRLASVGLI